jgi:hypothetical protein
MLLVQAHLEPPSDFDFRFRYGICSTNELDTFTGWFSRELADGPSAMAPLSLGAGRMRHLYQTVLKINFFKYPSTFGSDPSRLPAFMTGAVVKKYQMNVRSDGKMHSVQWDDDESDQGSQADGLRRLFGWAVLFINEAAEAKHLPPSPSAGSCGRQ